MHSSSSDDSESDTMPSPDLGDNVDRVTFDQILEMDESEEEREFSKPLVLSFFEQAEEAFNKMDVALKNRQLGELYSLGHYLKGSSATLGFNKVRDSCQVIQQYGNKVQLDGTPEPNEDVCIQKITEALAKAKKDTDELKRLLQVFFKIEAT